MTRRDARRAGQHASEPPLWRGVLVRLVISFALIAVITHLAARPFVVPSGSMEPTLRPGDRFVALVGALAPDELTTGDVVVFGHGETWSEDRLAPSGNPVEEVVRTAGDVLGVGPSHRTHTVKRVIGGPGQRVRCCDDEGHVEVDGVALTEDYLGPDLPFTSGSLDCTSATRSPRCFPEVAVPVGSYLVLGDHRANSADSVQACRGRDDPEGCVRLVREDQVVGVARWRAWPLPPAGLD